MYRGERDYDAYKGHYFVNANSTTAPQIADKAVKPILDRDEVYSSLSVNHGSRYEIPPFDSNENY